LACGDARFGTATAFEQEIAGLFVGGLRRTQVHDISPIAGLIKMQSLDLARTPVKNLEPLSAVDKIGHDG
jgi:hypothetical protein